MFNIDTSVRPRLYQAAAKRARDHVATEIDQPARERQAAAVAAPPAAIEDAMAEAEGSDDGLGFDEFEVEGLVEIVGDAVEQGLEEAETRVLDDVAAAPGGDPEVLGQHKNCSNIMGFASMQPLTPKRKSISHLHGVLLGGLAAVMKSCKLVLIDTHI